MFKWIGLGMPRSPFVVPAVIGALGPAELAATFLDGQSGFYYDASLGASLFQDTAGTTPAGIGDPVGRMKDYGAGGNNATQPNSAARPTRVAGGASYDGTSQYLVTPIIPAATGSIVFRLTFGPASENGRFFGSSDGTNDVSLNTRTGGLLRLTLGSSNYIGDSGDLQGATSTVAATWDGSNVNLYLDGVNVKSQAQDPTTIPTSAVAYIGAQNRPAGASLLFSGSIAKAGYVNRVIGASEMADWHGRWAA